MKPIYRILVILVAVVTAGSLWRHLPGAIGRGEIARAEADSRLRTKLALEAAEPERSKLAVVALSAQLLGELLEQWEGVTFTEPKTGVAITVAAIDPKFTAGFPRVAAKLTTEWKGRALILELDGVLKHALTDSGVRLEVQTLAVRANWLPWHLRALTSPAFASWLNGILEPIEIPLAQVAELAAQNPEIEDQWFNVPNGRVRMHFGLPALPALKIQSRAVAAFFDDAGLRILARLSSNGPLPAASPIAIPNGTAAPSVQELQAIIASWPGLPNGKSYFVHVPSQVVLDLLGAIAGPGLTFTLGSNAAEGLLMKKTGGPPFGYGFEVSLEHPNSLQAQAVVSGMKASWLASSGDDLGGIRATGNIAARGGVHLHLHSDTPIGGGMGSNVAGTVDARAEVKLVVRYESAGQRFGVRLESPSQCRMRIDVSGFPDAFEKWFDVLLPVNTDVYRFKLPPVIRPTFEVAMPKGFTPEVKVITPEMDAPEVRFLADALEVSGTVHLPAVLAAPAAATAAVKQP